MGTATTETTPRLGAPGPGNSVTRLVGLGVAAVHLTVIAASLAGPALILVTTFFEEGQLLRDAYKLKDIPITMINGRYDMICPPVMAWRLHKTLPKSKLIIIEEAGHSEGEPGTTKALVEAVAEFE